jgi:hypothetical protein
MLFLLRFKKEMILYSRLVAVETEEGTADCRLLLKRMFIVANPFFFATKAQGNKRTVKIYDFYHIQGGETRIFDLVLPAVQAPRGA